MALSPGAMLGLYEVRAKLGAGGMGEVYRATDTKLGRDVALKVLPEAFAQDTQRMQRFQREAQVLASLNHPHIAIIHGLEESGATRALVMELVEGPTLAERISQGPIPIDETLPIAKQIAEALEYAHEHGIIHRDLKPANIKFTPDGQVKVLDFGLAKALADDAASSLDLANSPTLSVAATKAGVILGTTAYMSPEQARGGQVDKRTDVWSYGCVLYEMLSGRRLFDETTTSDTLAAVLKGDLNLAALPAATPPQLRQLLRRCLERDRKRRLRDIGEARIALEDSGGSDAAVATPLNSAPRSVLLWAVLATALAVTAVATFFFTRLVTPAPPERALRKFEIPVADLTLGIQTPPVISPDGRRIAYIAGSGVWVRELERLQPKELVTGISPQYLMWSPDSRNVAYLADQKLWRLGIDGGQPAIVAAATFPQGGQTPGGVWTSDGRVIFAPATSGSDILWVSDQGGDFATLIRRDEKTESDFHKPSVLPDNKGMLVIVDHNEGGADTIEVISGETRRVVLQLPNEALDSPVYSPSGHLLYRRNTGNPGIWAVPFSLHELKVTGDPFLVVAEGAWPSVSSDGTLVYTTESEAKLELVLLNRKGEILRRLGQPRRYYRHPRFSPDGRKLAYYSGEAVSHGIHVFELQRNTESRLTFDANLNFRPAWSADGRRVFYESLRGGTASNIMVTASDGSGAPELVLEGLSEEAMPSADGKWVLEPMPSADGKWLLYARLVPGQGFDLFYIPLQGQRRAVPFVQARENQQAPAPSRDGRYVAYRSDEAGREEIFLRPFPTGDGKWQVSNNGGASPRWDSRGRLYYVQGGESLMEVEITTSPKLNVGTPRMLFTPPAGTDTGMRWDVGFDVSPDGNSIAAVCNAPGEKGVTQSLRVVENWFAEFQAKTKQ